MRGKGKGSGKRAKEHSRPDRLSPGERPPPPRLKGVVKVPQRVEKRGGDMGPEGLFHSGESLLLYSGIGLPGNVRSF